MQPQQASNYPVPVQVGFQKLVFRTSLISCRSNATTTYYRHVMVMCVETH